MWKLTKIEINNIVSFQEAVFEVKQGVATLIFGRNEDNSAQPNNGSGKSSLIEAISFALTGEPLRKVKSVEEIINDMADSASVEIVLVNDFNHTTFTISRTISRRAAQIIECHKYDHMNLEIELDKTVQPSVADYNRFILDEIGLTKEEIYNNFILCDNRYESFFDCSDKSKKEIINRFSNGLLVDAGMARILVDKMPLEDELAAAQSEVININGSISAIEQELLQADAKAEDAKTERGNRIQMLEEKIVKCREEITVLEEKKVKASERIALLKELNDGVSNMVEDGDGIAETYLRLLGICEKHDLGSITDYNLAVSQYKNQIASLQISQKAESDFISNLHVEIKKTKADYNAFLKSYEENVEAAKRASEIDESEIQKFDSLIKEIDKNLDALESDIAKNKTAQSEITAKIAHNNTLLSGAVTCPKCKHQFVASSGVSANEIEDTIKNLQVRFEETKSCYGALCDECERLELEADGYEAQIKNVKKAIRDRSANLESQYNSLKPMAESINRKSMAVIEREKKLTEIDKELSRIDSQLNAVRTRMFTEVLTLIENRLSSGEQYLSQQDSSITFIKGQIEQYRQSKRELISTPDIDFASSLKKSLETYKKKLIETQKEVDMYQKEYDQLLEQEVHFTMFKSYLARKKIDALSHIVNDFLEKIGSDIRLRLEGFSVTKSGKLRDKISVQVTRDGVDCGSYHKFSGGERARLNLACVLSLHALTNSNCEDGKGLDFLIIDEVLDKSDEMGMSTYCDALNKLGQTALLITQGNVSESYPHKLLIVKKQGISSIID